MIFFALEGTDVSVARRALLALFRPRSDIISRRFAFKNLSEVPRADTGQKERLIKQTEQNGCMAKTGHVSHRRRIDTRVGSQFIRFNTKQRGNAIVMLNTVKWRLSQIGLDNKELLANSTVATDLVIYHHPRATMISGITRKSLTPQPISLFAY